MSDLSGVPRGTFRANPAYEMVLFDRLAGGERQRLAELRHEAGFYGVLRPRAAGTGGGAAAAAGRSVKAVDRDTALLLFTLREPGPLPAYVEEVLGHGAGRRVAQLVADGVLEVVRDGSFVSGAAALDLVAGSGGRHRAAGAGGRIARLSEDALRHAQELPLDDALALSARLYGYNRLPLTPRWRRLLPDAAAVPSFLGCGAGGAAAGVLARHWEALPASPAWLSWRTRERRRDQPLLAPAASRMHKLYLSPEPERLAGDGFAAIVAAMSEAGVPHFKVGADAAGLLRADKIVAYFPDFESLARAAHGLTAALSGVPAQGVPFTAEIGGGGLLSWGADPPHGEGIPWEGQASWRLWLTHRLARAVLVARGDSGCGVEPWRFAIERLRLEGVDTDTWTPGALLWQEA